MTGPSEPLAPEARPSSEPPAVTPFPVLPPIPVEPVAADRAMTEAIPRVEMPVDRRGTEAIPRIRAERRDRTEPLPLVPHVAQDDRVWHRPPAHARPSPYGLRPVAMVGAIALIASAFLPWIRLDFDSMPVRIPAELLFTGRARSSFPSLGVILVGAGLMALSMSMVRLLSIPRRLLGLVGFAVPVGFVLQATLGPSGLPVADLFSLLGMGAYVAAAGGLLAAAG